MLWIETSTAYRRIYFVPISCLRFKTFLRSCGIFTQLKEKTSADLSLCHSLLSSKSPLTLAALQILLLGALLDISVVFSLLLVFCMQTCLPREDGSISLSVLRSGCLTLIKKEFCLVMIALRLINFRSLEYLLAYLFDLWNLCNFTSREIVIHKLFGFLHNHLQICIHIFREPKYLQFSSSPSLQTKYICYTVYSFLEFIILQKYTTVATFILIY